MSFPCSTCKREFVTDAEEFGHDCERLTSGIPSAVRFGTRPNGFGGVTSTRVDKLPAGTAATEKQLAFLRKLCDERGIATDDLPTTKAAASARIDALLKAPRIAPTAPAPKAAPTPAPKATPVVDEGFYLDPDTEAIFKVQVAVHGSGRPYAKRLVRPSDEVIEQARKDSADAVARGDKPVKVKGSWVYEAGLIRKLNAEWRLNDEQARKWGQLYGVCCRCAAVLTDEHSIAQGIGPVCATKGF